MGLAILAHGTLVLYYVMEVTQTSVILAACCDSSFEKAVNAISHKFIF